MPAIVPAMDGLITTDQAAALCGVTPITVRAWINRGFSTPDGTRRLPVARRWKGRILLDPVEVAKAEHATARRARREIQPTAA